MITKSDSHQSRSRLAEIIVRNGEFYFGKIFYTLRLIIIIFPSYLIMMIKLFYISQNIYNFFMVLLYNDR